MALAPFDTDDDSDLSIRGEIATTSVPDLLRSVLQSSESGVLSFRSAEVTKSVFVKQGRVVNASSTDPDERLGENLLLRGRITARQYVEASRRIRPGRRLGAILVDLQALDPEDLVPAVEGQVRDILMDLFTWTSGEYEFVIRELDSADVVPLTLSGENLILEGIRRTQSWSRVLRGISSLDAVPVRTELSEHRLELTSEEQEVLANVNGRSTAEQICQVSYLSNFETLRILWAFAVLGLVRNAHAADAEGVVEVEREREQELDLEQVVERFNQMFGKIYQFLKGRQGDAVDGFMEGAMDEVSRQYGRLFDGVDLKHYGRADFEQMLANVADLPADQRRSLIVAGLNELVFVLQLAVRTQLGREEEAVVSGLIKEGFRKIGPA
jgi:Domain of unknown function (DUF4388)